MPFTGHGALAQVEALQQPGREADDPAMDTRMIDADAALSHHLFQVAQAQPVGQIPADAQQNDRLIKMAAFEHHKPSENRRRLMPGTRNRKYATEPSELVGLDFSRDQTEDSCGWLIFSRTRACW